MAQLKPAVSVRPKMSAPAATAKTHASQRMPAAGQPGRHPPEPPKGGRSRATYDKLIRAAGELLGEIGFEKLTTNAVCAKAGLTPPALYHYFRDKYELLEALARKLLEKQTEAFANWASQGSRWKDPGGRAALEEWFRTSIELTLSEPGAIWTLRALRALPNLAHIRLESQRRVTDVMFHHFRPLYPSVPSIALWCRLRIIAEFGFNVDELALEEDRIPHDVLFREAARVLAIPYGRAPTKQK